MAINHSEPDFIFETSWEVCNKVGGIYTVLSTRALTMCETLGADRILFIGPKLENTHQNDFKTDTATDQEIAHAIEQKTGLPLVVGRWGVPGAPRCILVDYKPLFDRRDTLYYTIWEEYGIRSELGYGDYDDSCLFGIAAAMVMQAYASLLLSEQRSIAIFNEWTTGMGLLYAKLHAPALSSVFITHATTVGRSIAGNGKPLYDYIHSYHGDQMAHELNVEAKHAIEKAAAHEADAFGTVSEVTNVECTQLLERPADVILHNGFENDFVPTKEKYQDLRAQGRAKVIQLASLLYGKEISEEATIIATSGRAEYRNKGLDVYIESLAGLAKEPQRIPQDTIALILVPGWVREVRPDLLLAYSLGKQLTLPMSTPFITHRLNDAPHNPIYNHLCSHRSLWGKRVFPIFIPAYLDGKDGLLDTSYYDLLPAIDLTIFPSYYEPWGYTPLESIAFGVPTVTTNKSGFGLWVEQERHTTTLDDGVAVLIRNDHNFDRITAQIQDLVLAFEQATDEERAGFRSKATATAARAEWSLFYSAYRQIYRMALRHHTRSTETTEA